MKKLILGLLIGGFVMVGASAKTAVVYFSATGTTERMAKNAAQAMGADIIEIQPVHKYTKADLNWRDKKSLTTIECNDPSSRPAIANKIDIAEYDTVVVCYPIWWAYAPKIVYTFIESAAEAALVAAEAALVAAEATLQSSPKALTLRAEKTLLAEAEPTSKIMLKAC